MNLFADDSIVYHEIQTSACGHLALESDVNKLHCWAKMWQMDFNVSKCTVRSVMTKRKSSTYDYCMDDQQIPRTDNQEHLGITINTKLSWQTHIKKVQNKARKTLGLIKRTLHAAPPQVRKTAHEVFFRPTLEYATCGIHSPRKKSQYQRQKRFRKLPSKLSSNRRSPFLTLNCTIS